MKDSTANTKKMTFSRRDFLSLSGKVGLSAALPSLFGQKAYAALSCSITPACLTPLEAVDWLAEARIGGLSVSMAIDKTQLKIDLSRLIKQGVTVIEADSGLSDYLSDDEFSQTMQRIGEITGIIHSQDLKVVWYIPALEVITPNGAARSDSFAKTHSDWLQVSFDKRGHGAFVTNKTDESAWLCPNSPYREFFKKRLVQLAKTNVDGIWLDMPVFNQNKMRFPCACHYCQSKFSAETGHEFPSNYDASDPSFWRYVRWRHDVLTKFLDDCRAAVEEGSLDAITFAQVSSLDNTDATQLGVEGSDLENVGVIWEVGSVSQTTAMAGASYDDWIALHNTYKYCRGATMSSPSWAFCYGYNEADAQLVLASAIAAQNNPYELRVPHMASSVGSAFRATQFNWIKKYSKQIFRSSSLSAVAVLYSERNRDFLDIKKRGGAFVNNKVLGRWATTQKLPASELEYMGDYRGLSLLLYQNQIPTDVYPLSRVDEELLGFYKVLVLPFMASLSKNEKRILLSAVRNGTTLIITGAESGMWDEKIVKRQQSLWHHTLGGSSAKEVTVNYGRGKLFVWKTNVGQEYLKTHDHDVVNKLLRMVNQGGVNSWLAKKSPVVIQPYLYGQQMVIHVLNYSWVGQLENTPNRVNVELSIPWDSPKNPAAIVQTEPDWQEERVLKFSKRNKRLVVSLNVGINAMVLVNLNE